MAYQSKSKINQVIDIIQDRIKSNHTLLRLLSCDDSNVDIYKLPPLTRNEANKIVRDRVLSRPKEFQDNYQCCYMVLQYGNKIYHHNKSFHFNGHTFDITILCHNDIKLNDHTGDRIAEIEQIIEDLFDNSFLDKVACKCNVSKSEPVYARSSDYSGRRITLSFSDFKE